MYDQLAGGFARYSVDAAWVVPHFEKMLYDNAQLLRVYLPPVAGHRLAAGGAGRAARRPTSCCATWRTPEGGFASALDADTDGRRGPDLRLDARPAGRGARRARTASGPPTCSSVTGPGTFEHGTSTLQLRDGPGTTGSGGSGCGTGCWPARDRRPQPARDDKVVTAWNGLAIAALAEAGVLLDEPRYLDAAAAAAPSSLLDVHWVDGRLRRVVAGRRGRRRGGGGGGLRRPGRGAAGAAPGHRRAALAGRGRRAARGRR